MKRLTGLVAAILVSGFVLAEDNVYLIQGTIVDGDRVLASPAVVAESGKQVTVIGDGYL
jgi:hypothetical protein